MLQYYAAMTGKEKLPRAERRRLMKEQKISKEEAKNLYRPTATIHDYMHYYDLAIVDALYCELNLPNTRIKEVFDKIKLTIDCLATGHISCFDLEHMVEAEVGIKFKRK